MQHSPHEITEKLLKALDEDYNVVDMAVVIEIIGILERTCITMDVLQTTRLGKHINELRRKTSDESVARRAKDLVRKWRDLILPQAAAAPSTPAAASSGSDGGLRENGSRPGSRVVSPDTAGAWNRSGPVSPALSVRRSHPTSPALVLDERLSPTSQRRSLSPRLHLPATQSIQLPHNSGVTRGRPPREPLKSPPRPRGRPPLDRPSDQPQQRGRGRPPLDGSKPRGRPPSTPGVAPRGRGRPPKNKNKLKTSQESTLNSNLVPKTSPANKRLRKSSQSGGDGEDSPSSPKKQRMNGAYSTHDPKVPDIVINNDQVPSELVKIPKKRGRKKGSKNAPKRYSLEDSVDEDDVKEKMALVPNRKVKTNRELLAQMERGSSLEKLRNATLRSLGVDGDRQSAADTPPPIPKLEIPHKHKFLRTQPPPPPPPPTVQLDPEPQRPPSRLSDVVEIVDLEDDLIDVEKVDSPVRMPETVEEILAKLPAINHDEILWSDSEEEEEDDDDSETEAEGRERREVTEGDVDRLHAEHLEGVNGNFNEGALVQGLRHGLKVPLCDISDKDNDRELPNTIPKRCETGTDAETPQTEDNFREWQESVSRRSYNGELLHILPYVVVD